MEDRARAFWATVAVTAITPTVWGTTYFTTTQLLPDNRPLLAGTLRALPAGLLLAGLGRRLPRGSWWWKSVVLGVLNIGAFFPLLFLAAYRLPGGVAAAVGAIQPLVAAALAAVLLGERFSAVNLLTGLMELRAWCCSYCATTCPSTGSVWWPHWVGRSRWRPAW